MFSIAKKAGSAGPIEFLIVGLGNPGKKYENTRHNAGFMAIDALSSKCNITVDRIKFKGMCGEGILAQKKVLLLKPSTFMNLSGESVQEAMNFYKIPPEKVLIIYDDISLDPGKLRIRRKGSDGGHNGIKNIIYLSGSDAFPRIKIGVGKKPNPNWDLADWVLSHFTENEQKELLNACMNSADAAELIVSGKIDEAMNRFNS